MQLLLGCYNTHSWFFYSSFKFFLSVFSLLPTTFFAIVQCNKMESNETCKTLAESWLFCFAFFLFVYTKLCKKLLLSPVPGRFCGFWYGLNREIQIQSVEFMVKQSVFIVMSFPLCYTYCLACLNGLVDRIVWSEENLRSDDVMMIPYYYEMRQQSEVKYHSSRVKSAAGIAFLVLVWS